MVTAASYLRHTRRPRSACRAGGGICRGTGRCAGPWCCPPSEGCSAALWSCRSATPPPAPDRQTNLTGRPMTAPSDPWANRVRHKMSDEETMKKWKLLMFAVAVLANQTEKAAWMRSSGGAHLEALIWMRSSGGQAVTFCEAPERILISHMLYK